MHKTSRQQIGLIINIFLLGFSSSACAHNTEGMGAALLGLISWPIVVWICTLSAAKGYKITTFLITAIGFPYSIYLADKIAIPLSDGSWTLEYELNISIVACFWLLVIASLKYSILQKRLLGLFNLIKLAVLIIMIRFVWLSFPVWQNFMFIPPAILIKNITSGLLLLTGCYGLWNVKAWGWWLVMFILIPLKIILIALNPNAFVTFNVWILMFPDFIAIILLLLPQVRRRIFVKK